MLPRLLAGPALRNCTPSRLTIWLAASERLPKLRVVLTAHPGTPVPAQTTTVVIDVGARLFIHLLLVEGSFPTDRLLSYDIPELTDEEKAGLAYAGLSPSLLLSKEGSQQFRALHGSCRKSGGPKLDATLAGDALMKRFVWDMDRRPHALLLTGDQIYADDVPDMFIKSVHGLGVELMGFDELMPDVQQSVPVHGRQALMAKAGFTSSAAANHLWTFGEYCAAYLLAWNHGLWREAYLLAGYDMSVDSPLPGDLELPTDGQVAQTLPKEAPKNFASQRQNLTAYREGSKAMRRLLANVPTYMIFDDHEVTDDWFLNDTVRNAMKKTSLGKRVIAHGLAAYWLFQGVGNDFEKFFTRDFASIATHLRAHLNGLKADGDPDGKDSKDFDHYVLDYDRRWSFLTPTSPGVLFLNTRTRRGMSRSKRHTRFTLRSDLLRFGEVETERFSYPSSAPRLMNPTELGRVKTLLEEAIRRDKRVVIVAPGPVYGLDTEEDVVSNLVSSNKISPTAADLETFHSDPNSFLDLAELLLNPLGFAKDSEWPIVRPSVVVILSGDVHYGFSIAASLIDFDPSPGNAAVPVAQFTSSAVKNNPTGTDALLLGIAQKVQSFSRDNVQYWWRPEPGVADSHACITVHDPAVSGSHYDLFKGALEIYSEGCAKESGQARFRVVNAYKFKIDESNVVETENNMGFLEMSGLDVSNRLIKWSGSLTESFKTSWNAKSSWPVSLVDRRTNSGEKLPALPPLPDFKPLPR